MGSNKTTINVVEKPWQVYPGPILLLAGPGTGKTYQIVQRIKFLTKDKNISPKEISVITFTREAAKSMRKRISDPANEDEYIEQKKRPNISTIHSMAYRVIKDNHDYFKLSENFHTLSDGDLKKILMRDSALLVEKNESNAQKALKTRGRGEKLPIELSDIVEKYEMILRMNDHIDYDDQISLACDILKKEKSVLKECALKTKYLLVDEYQDINEKQFEFIELISRTNRKGLFVVGDDDQSIYSFRGGTPKYVRSFIKDFKNAENPQIINMNISRRCPKNILNCANAVVKNFNLGRLEKPEPKYEKEDPGIVKLHICPSENFEAKIIASIVANVGQKSVYILVPSKFYVPKIREALIKKQINPNCSYEIKNGLKTLNLLGKFLEKPNDNFIVRQVIATIIESNKTKIPSSKVTSEKQKAKRLKALSVLATIWELSFKKNISYRQALEKMAVKNEALADLVKRINLILCAGQEKPPIFLKEACDIMHLWPSMNSLIKEVFDIHRAMRYKGSAGTESEVRILSFQAAKGLQADVVFVVALEGDIFLGDVSPEDKPEKARLLFVSMTRAISELHLCVSRTRTGNITLKKKNFQLTPCEFINCLPKEFYEVNQLWPSKHKLKRKPN